MTKLKAYFANLLRAVANKISPLGGGGPGAPN
jgi:hypothetical protein